MNTIKDTEKTYGHLWYKDTKSVPAEKWHFDAMQKAIIVPIVRGRVGIEVGCGCGYDTYIMAKNNPSVKFVSIDLSDGVYTARKMTSALPNVSIVKCSALDLPVKDASMDFAYSFGVLHHTPDPKKGLMEIARALKKGAPAFLYLYEDHSENILKFIGIKLVACARVITTRIPQDAMNILTWILSPFVFLTFSVPAKIFSMFKATRPIAGSMPFNFGTGPFSLRRDLYDRLRAPLEYRFSRGQALSMLHDCGFSKVEITRLKDTAGWVIWGYKDR